MCTTIISVSIQHMVLPRKPNIKSHILISWIFLKLAKAPRSPQLLHQSELNDLVLDLALSKICAELLTSRLNENNLHSSTRTTYDQEIEEEACQYLSQEESIVFCQNFEKLLLYLGRVFCDLHN